MPRATKQRRHDQPPQSRRLAPSVMAGSGREYPTLRAAWGSSPEQALALGQIGRAVRVSGIEDDGVVTLHIPIDPATTRGIDPASARLFRWDRQASAYEPVWSSGVNTELGYAWAVLGANGVYAVLGLPEDKLLREALREVAYERRTTPPGRAPEQSVARLLSTWSADSDASEDLDRVRRFLTRLEFQTGRAVPDLAELEVGTGGHIERHPLPGGRSLEELGKQLEAAGLDIRPLPEEALFFPPGEPSPGQPPWDLAEGYEDWVGIDVDELTRHRLPIDPGRLLPPWVLSKNWWMYQHDVRHTGHASGGSGIDRANVSRLKLVGTLPVDGPIVTKAAIVDGKVYVGSGRQAGSGGTLYKFNLHTGAKEGEFPTSGLAFYTWVSGIGGSPAVVGGRVYFTGVHGKVYCVDGSTMTPNAPHPPAIWETDLSVASAAKNQPVNQPDADSWSGPLVVNGRVYVGCGEGEDPQTYGFVYCLDADTGRVEWLFCTCKFSGASDNAPNAIPQAIAAPWAAGAGFTVLPNPQETGCAVWSSCAHDAELNRIYVGTGNSQYPDTAQPDEPYGSGLIALDATTGAFEGFFQPSPDDSYWPGDSDIDVPGSATVVVRGSDRVIAFGSKNGSFFLLDPDTLAPIARRQLLPRLNGTGLPGNRGTGIDEVVPNGGTGENKWGVFGTPAVHWASGRLFVGLGGYNGMAVDEGAGIDQTRTPFMRALDWSTLSDAWPTAVGSDGVIRYTTTKPPMYLSREVGLSSPAVVNDVVFVSTNKAALYALDVETGVCLWAAGGLPTDEFALGPAISGNYVVVGAGDNLYVYSFGLRLPKIPEWVEAWPWWWRWPWPPPTPERPDLVLETRIGEGRAEVLGP